MSSIDRKQPMAGRFRKEGCPMKPEDRVLDLEDLDPAEAFRLLRQMLHRSWNRSARDLPRERHV